MARRSSNKRPLRLGKDYPGCMWALISLFNIRHGLPTHKLLSDKMHGESRQASKGSSTEVGFPRSSENQKDFDGTAEGCSGTISGMSSVKTLIEEEMSQEHFRNTDAGLKFQHSKSQKQTSKKLMGISDVSTDDLLAPVSLDGQSHYTITSENSSLNFDLAALLLKYYGQGHQWQQLFEGGNVNSKVDVCTALMTIYGKMHDQLDVPNSLFDKKWPMLVKALADLAEEITSKNISDEKLLTALRAIGPKEFLDALDIDQIKEALLKLLSDPLSHKQITDARNSQIQSVTKPEINNIPRLCDKSDHNEIQKKKKCGFFSKKEKLSASETSVSSSNSTAPDTIVLLKPGLLKIDKSSSTSSVNTKLRRKEDGEKGFSIKEIKRRIRSIFGESKKEQHHVSMDGILHRLAIECHDLVDSNKPAADERGEMNFVRTFDDNAVTSSQSVEVPSKIGPENCNVNGKREVAFPLSTNLVNEEITLEKTASQPQAQASMSTEKTFIFQESVEPSIGRDDELALSLYRNSTSSENEMLGSEYELVASHKRHTSCTIVDLSDEETAETVAEADEQPVTPLTLQHEKLDVVNEKGTEVEASFVLDSATQNKKTRAVALSGLAPSPVKVESAATLESTAEKPGKGSPVSVLDEFDFSEDTMSPDHTPITQSSHLVEPENSPDATTPLKAEATMTPFCAEQARLMYIETVLEASGLSTDEFSEKWDVEDELLEPSLFDELGDECYPLDTERRILFDCINEVLMELRESFSRYGSSAHNRKFNARCLVREVSRTVELHFSSELPETIEQMIQLDFCCKTWMNLEVEIEEVVSEVWNIILDDIMEEIAYGTWLADTR